MDTEDNGLSLQGLAQRLETLERENERMRSESEQMRSENTELRREVSALRGSDTHRDGEPVSEFEGQVSRRALLSKAGAAAVAAMAAGTLLGTRQAKANHFGDGINVDFVWAHHEGSGAIGVLGQAPGDRPQGRGFYVGGSRGCAGPGQDWRMGQLIRYRLFGRLRAAHGYVRLWGRGRRQGWQRWCPGAQPQRPRYRGAGQQIRREVCGKPGAVAAITRR
jgi:hypothetical protein